MQQLIYRAPSESRWEQSYLISYYGHCRRPAEHVVPPRFPWLPISAPGDSGHRINFWKDSTQCAWARRGWTFQESFLSPRKIVFGNAEVHFVSHGQAISRTGSSAVDVWVPFDQLTTVPQIRSAWIEVMKQCTRFTSASFTIPTDLLPALSGLASRFGDLLPEDVYQAGHWSGDLHVSLMWALYDKLPSELGKYQDESAEQRLMTVELVPSWSCISRGVVYFRVDLDWAYQIRSRVLRSD